MSKDNVLIKAIASSSGGKADIKMQGIAGDETSLEMKTFQSTQRLRNSTLYIVLKKLAIPTYCCIFMLLSFSGAWVAFHRQGHGKV